MTGSFQESLQAGVLLEVGHLLTWWLFGVAPGADELTGTRGDLVSVDLVPRRKSASGHISAGWRRILRARA